MKKFLLSLLLCSSATFGVSALSVDITPNATNTGETSSSYIETAKTYTVNKVSYVANNFNPSTGQIRGNQTNNAKNFSLSNTVAAENIQSITFTLSTGSLNTSNITFKTGETSATEVGVITANGNTCTFTPATGRTTDSFFSITFANKATTGTVKVSKIEIVYNPSTENPELGAIKLGGAEVTESAMTATPGQILVFSADNATSMSTQIGEDGELTIVETASINWTAPTEGGTYKLIVNAYRGEDKTNCVIDVTVPTMAKTTGQLDITPNAANTGKNDTKYIETEFEYSPYDITINANNVNPSTGQIRGNKTGDSNFYIVNATKMQSIGRIVVKISSGLTSFKPENTVFTTGETADALNNEGYYLIDNATNSIIYCIKADTENQHFFKLALNNGATAGTCTVESIIVHFNPDAPAAATTVFHGTETGTGNTIDLAGDSKKIHFTTSNGVNVWYKFVADDDNEIQPQAETDEDGFTKYEGTDGIELTTIGNLLHYTEQFGVKSDVQTIRVSDSTTSISEITAEGAAAGAIYDLQGRKVVAPAKGIFIVNGKKVRM